MSCLPQSRSRSEMTNVESQMSNECQTWKYKTPQPSSILNPEPSMLTRSLAVLALLASPAFAADGDAALSTISAKYRKDVAHRLDASGKNREHLVAALQDAD